MNGFERNAHHRADPLRRLDTLSAIAARPALVEHAVRSALALAMTWRLGGGAPPGEVAFTCAAVAAARARATTENVPPASVAVLSRATARAAQRLFRVPLVRRLLTMPSTLIVAVAEESHAPIALVRDSANHLHAIALTVLRRPLEIGERAHRLAAQTIVPPHDRLSPVRVHMLSLITGRRYEYHCPASAARATKRSA